MLLERVDKVEGLVRGGALMARRGIIRRISGLYRRLRITASDGEERKSAKKATDAIQAALTIGPGTCRRRLRMSGRGRASMNAWRPENRRGFRNGGPIRTRSMEEKRPGCRRRVDEGIVCMGGVGGTSGVVETRRI
jgi:hypothetical protein